MPTSVDSLPFEVLSLVLEEIARQNHEQLSTYTYGLSQSPEPGQEVRMQRIVRGNKVPDVLRWQATEGLRQVCQRWHDWACFYSLRDLYISRWRGSERYDHPCLILIGR